MWWRSQADLGLPTRSPCVGLVRCAYRRVSGGFEVLLQPVIKRQLWFFCQSKCWVAGLSMVAGSPCVYGYDTSHCLFWWGVFVRLLHQTLVACSEMVLRAASLQHEQQEGGCLPAHAVTLVSHVGSGLRCTVLLVRGSQASVTTLVHLGFSSCFLQGVLDCRCDLITTRCTGL